MLENKEEFNRPGKGQLNKLISVSHGLWDENFNWLLSFEENQKCIPFLPIPNSKDKNARGGWKGSIFIQFPVPTLNS